MMLYHYHSGKFAPGDYLYSEGELDEWVAKIETIAEQARETYIMQNNHPRGQAVCNAMQMRSKLGGKNITIPDTMLPHFPQLEGIAEPTGFGQAELF